MKVGVSACLLGKECTYKGSSNFVATLNQINVEWVEICPEVMGGLSIPRPPAEIVDVHPLKVLNNKGQNVTHAYIKGANEALLKLKENDVHVCLLKHRSPSCGCDGIYDGTFSHTVVDGQGVCAKMLNNEGIKTFHEGQIDLFLQYLMEEIEDGTYFKD